MSGVYVFHIPISLWKYVLTLFNKLDSISSQLILLLIRQVYLYVGLLSFGLEVGGVCCARDLIRDIFQELCRVMQNYYYGHVNSPSITELCIFTICTHHLPLSRSFHPTSAKSLPRLSVSSDQATALYFNQDDYRIPG